MDNVTHLSDVSITHQDNCLDPLEEILSFYEQAESDEEIQVEQQIDFDVTTKKPQKINFSQECQRLIESIEKAQKKSEFYLSEILSFNEED